jgi:hypothetical protein
MLEERGGKARDMTDVLAQRVDYKACRIDERYEGDLKICKENICKFSSVTVCIDDRIAPCSV